MFFSSVLNIDNRTDRSSRRNTFTFDSDSSTVICDNSANVHICNDKGMFIGDLRPANNQTVATIGGKSNVPGDIGTVQWTWRDDDGTSYKILVQDVLFFPASPINILSVTSFANQLGDDFGTGCDTKRHTSRFY